MSSRSRVGSKGVSACTRLPSRALLVTFLVAAPALAQELTVPAPPAQQSPAPQSPAPQSPASPGTPGHPPPAAPPTPASPREVKPKSTAIRVLQGTPSAGSINATIAAFEHCRLPQPNPKASAFWNVWMPVGIDELLPDVHSHSPVNILSRAPLEGAAERLRSLVENEEGWRKEPCQVPIGIVATRVAPDSRPNGLVSTAVTERFALVLDTRVPGRLAHWTGFGQHYQSGAPRPDDSTHDPAQRPVLHPVPTTLELDTPRLARFATCCSPLPRSL
jgi:hypothetical protein